jgi:uncharacterized protein YutE (UPF0331/DUF86 family)
VVDRDLVRRKLADLALYVQQVSEYRHITVGQYRQDWKVQRIIERTLQIAIEACMDIASHAIADRGLRVPATYAEAFQVLADAGLIDRELEAAVVRMTGFRSVIVPDYARVNRAIVVDVLRNRLEDFARFRAVALE